MSKYNYSSKSKSVQKKYRKFFIAGMAMHTATDVYAHSSIVNSKLLNHTQNNDADNPNIAISRWSAAYGTAIDIAKCLRDGCEGDLREFTQQSSCFDGSFKLANVMKYAEQVGISNYYDESTLRKKLKMVSTGKDSD